MAHLARLGFVHGGLSSSNVLLDAKGRAKISDLGDLLRTPSHTTASSTSTSKGSAAAPEAGEKRPSRTIGMRLRYTAPEVLSEGESVASIESDAYSFGMVVLECLTRELPWKGVVAEADGAAALVLAVTAGERPPVPENVPRDLAALARACWSHEPRSRPTLEVVLADFQSAGGVFKDGGAGGNVTTPARAPAGGKTKAGPAPRVSTTTGFPPIPSTPRRRSARRTPRKAPGTPTGQRTASPDTVVSGEAARTAAALPPPSAAGRSGRAVRGSGSGSGSSGRCAGGDKTKEPRGVLSLIEHLQRAKGDTVGRLSSGELSPCAPSPPPYAPSPPEMGALCKR
ncbi:unnamed protein product [Scytosiphon promiscuus]